MANYQVNQATIDAKAAKVDEVTEKFKNATSFVVVSSRGLTVAQDTELRKNLREAGVELHVIKNTILSRAAEKAGFDGDFLENFVGPSAVAFSNEDAVAPAKVLSDFAKTADKLEIKAGVIEGKISSKEEIAALAALPNREGLLSMLLSVLQAPIRNVAYAVNAVIDAQGGVASVEATNTETAEPAKEEAPAEEAKAEETPAEEAPTEEAVAEEAPAEETSAEDAAE